MNNTKRFPYVIYEGICITRFWKQKYPFIVKEDIGERYKQYGHKLLENFTEQGGNRFNVEKRAFEKPNNVGGYFNSVTISKPSSEVICLKRYGEKVKMALILQSRTPYIAEVWDEEEKEYVRYARFFFELPAGLLEAGESFEDAAIRETQEEIGFEVLNLRHLMKQVICRHVSYSDESSEVFVAQLGDEIGQKLDKNENIHVFWFSLKEVEKELEKYLEGEKNNFFGYDVPEMTILGLQRFFIKWNRGDFKDFI